MDPTTSGAPISAWFQSAYSCPAAPQALPVRSVELHMPVEAVLAVKICRYYDNEGNGSAAGWPHMRS